MAVPRKPPPPLDLACILAWADAFHTASGKWPKRTSGRRGLTRGDTWLRIDEALRCGNRGLSPGSSLARLLSAERGVTHHKEKPRLTVDHIVAWARAHHERHGGWPSAHSGAIKVDPQESWAAIDAALREGRRGLPKGGSLASLLSTLPDRRNVETLPELTTAVILAWADAFFARCGRWPTRASGVILDGAGETWMSVDRALGAQVRLGTAHTSLKHLLQVERGARFGRTRCRLSEELVLAWARGFHDRHGAWPTMRSGAIGEKTGFTWSSVDKALRYGRRGLPGGSSLHSLIRRMNSSEAPSVLHQVSPPSSR